MHAKATLDQRPLSQWWVAGTVDGGALFDCVGARKFTQSSRHFVVFDLDAQHCVAIAVKQTGHDFKWDCPRFREVSFKDLVGAASSHTHPVTTMAKLRSL